MKRIVEIGNKSYVKCNRLRTTGKPQQLNDTIVDSLKCNRLRTTGKPQRVFEDPPKQLSVID